MNKSFLASVVEVFATYPEANAVYLCEDGSVFLEERINLAQNYSRENRFGAPQLVTREDAEAMDKATGKVQEVVDDIKARKDAEAAAADQAAKAVAEQEAKDIAAAAADGVIVKKDGDAWLAHRNDFINLQESPAGYGDSIAKAVENLKAREASLEEAAANQTAQDAARQAEKDNKPNNGKRR
ncbi:MAG: hypothetical protein JNJ91_05300 [Flavobacteriales bacterium]|nr:hypothetical protein [Flavobacteriales bacterium]